MTSDNFSRMTAGREIETLTEPRDRLTIARTHVSFKGILRRHPTDPEKVVLIPDPYGSRLTYFEFSRSDIQYFEKLAPITKLKGDTANITRIWVRKNRIAVRCAPFLVNLPETIP